MTITTAISTMIDQLGGARIFAMAFAASTYDATSITLQIAKPLVKNVKGKATHVTVTLADDDTYTVLVQRVPTARQMIAGHDIVETGRMEMVYADSLRAAVESMTGLALTLSAMRAA